MTDPNCLSLNSAEAEQLSCKARGPHSNSHPPRGPRNPQLSGNAPPSPVAALSEGGRAPSPLMSPAGSPWLLRNVCWVPWGTP